MTADRLRPGARRVLMRRDPVLGAAIRQIGPCGMAARERTDHLTALVRAIVSQQLSTKAAATIFGRLVALFPDGADHGVGPSGAGRCGAARRRVERTEGRLPARPLRPHRGRTAVARRARRAARRGGHRAAHRGEGIRPVDRRDVPDVPPASARRPAGRRSRHLHGRAAPLSAAQRPKPKRLVADRRSLAALSVRRVLVSVAEPEDSRLGARRGDD